MHFPNKVGMYFTTPYVTMVTFLQIAVYNLVLSIWTGSQFLRELCLNKNKIVQVK